MKYLILGDIVGTSGLNRLKQEYERLVKENDIDVSIVNGENSAHGKGLRNKEYDEIVSLGVDVITMGNHLYYRKEMAKEYLNLPRLVVPANVTNIEGNNYVILEKKGIKIAVINLLGKVNMGEIFQDVVTSPFDKASELVKVLKEQDIKHILIDFHAEATAEKLALGYYLENDITCLFGTHTHVQTSDEKIVNNQMAYITDIGMIGPKDSVIGLRKEIALKRFSTGEFVKYECSNNEAILNGIIVEVDDSTGKAISIKRINE